MSNRKRSLFTSESVSMGHPDKVSDQISDAILDALFEQDNQSRVACETLVNTGLVVVSGEITTKAVIDVPDIVRRTIKRIGYDDSTMGFDYKCCAVMVSLDRQSADISQGVTADESLHRRQGAGDQGMMFGFACRETPELMPLPISLAHKLVAKLATARQTGTLAYLRPDGKSQVTIEYANGEPKRVHTVVISNQHDEDVDHKTLRDDIIKKIIKETIPDGLLDDDTIYHVNPTGRFVVGGPHGDCGLTGRKNIVDTYGGRGRHGGGAFSGKDPSKVDRSAAYAARWVAKNIIAAGLADICEIQLSYAIGVADPVSLLVSTEGTAKISEEKIEDIVKDHFDLTPSGIISALDLRRPIYEKTAYHGHFGREDQGFTWELTNKADELRKAAGL
ncbi:MAG: methionine adenosyltransferase [Planctomycetota bacterium]|nr:methionine adenosyltransferase [Planctomycetota bacterium]